jgi:DNA-directed RNA polymerase specialized sigma24 family protein
MTELRAAVLDHLPHNDGPSGGEEESRAERPNAEGQGYPNVQALLKLMRTGDRGASAAFITRYGPQIRRRIRGKLSPGMRRIFDSQEILSTLGRRLDHYVKSGKLEARNEAQLWSLVLRMANNAVVDKARVFRRLERVEDEDSPFAHELSSRLRTAEQARKEGAEIEIETALNVLTDRVDRMILSMWLNGTQHKTIAVYVDLAPTAVRKRWQKIRETLHGRFLEESRA